MNIDFEEVKKKFGKKAKEYANDKEKSKGLVKDAVNKAKKFENKKGPLEEIWDNVQLLFGLIKDWASGEYKDVPTGSIILIIIGLLYFVSPIDLVPDFIPGGIIDDAIVLGIVIKQVVSDLDKYRLWKENQ